MFGLCSNDYFLIVSLTLTSKCRMSVYGYVRHCTVISLQCAPINTGILLTYTVFNFQLTLIFKAYKLIDCLLLGHE